ncbi:hypothetical protein GE253_13385 [Niveispirillum sp. SYP-B3756]|uniref:hypothetical protein n=1 Tax=Niveispirillum sp. SYP-B3756 TaxID=2662178 RepID=UPI001290E0DB|nr:hypothetical protein [Niveispirillum sp. SYP-B3756]MQP66331.1 hypothetical protein [Niveispirillum sp. SYP-B3756]
MSDFTFGTPAFIVDFPDSTASQTALAALWNDNLKGFVQQAMPAAPSFFYDPTDTDIPADTPTAQVSWSAFSGRLMQYCSATPPIPPANPYNLGMQDIYSLADTGYYGTAATALPDIPAQFCPEANWNGPLQKYGPYGPRGWHDEYCEWAAARDENNNIIRVDFCCENPEYWYSLWAISPTRVVELYNEILNYGLHADRLVVVTEDDLTLKDGGGNVVTDPGTGRAAYNPLNKWNSGPKSSRTGSLADRTGGAVHLTSTPNTLQTEIGLAGVSTQQLVSGNDNAQNLLCCGQFGQAYRNSDPHIGQTVNRVVGGQVTGTFNLINLANPFGLYIQMPNFTTWSFGARIKPGTNVPADAKPSDVWQVVRGSATLVDPVTGENFPGNTGDGGFILHAACQIPLSWLAMDSSLTLADIQINGSPITWAGQIAQQFDVGLYARPLLTEATPPTLPCAGAGAQAAPLQCMYSVLWDAYYAVAEPNPTGFAIPMASNTTMIAPFLPAGGAKAALTLIVSPYEGGTLPKVAVLTELAGGEVDGNITVNVTGASSVTYSVPGNSYPGTYTALTLEVSVASGASPGLRAVAVTLNEQAETMAALVHITAGA